MNTKKLIEHALEKTEMWPLHEGPRTGEESLMIAQLELLAVIAQELKRMNDITEGITCRCAVTTHAKPWEHDESCFYWAPF
jgi:hypothetical protein